MEKNVIAITGGTGGIGSASCREFAKQGYAVMLCDVFQDRVDALVKELRDGGAEAAAMGRVQGVIQLGGLTPAFASAGDIVRVDTLGPIHINDSFFDVMESGGCIVDICSSTAHFVPFQHYPTDIFRLSLTDHKAFYDEMLKLCTKGPAEDNMHANMAYTWSRCFIYWYARFCAETFGRKKGIRVVTVSPGVIQTENSMAGLKKSGSGMENFNRTMSWTALGRPGRTEEIAYLFTTIVDPRNSYLTGLDIYLDGGADASDYHGQREWYPGTEPKN